ncbi:Na+ringenin-chalcone synthase [Halalkalibacter wakoensis JCM 9140]|uniref:Na+ringenin-chalcone synthase n=1 Tax=Halalkalibacter wakoensis JCM 9140 TaxID=1236970 RepID=W4Q775_9BACI|nr:Na+ringenin-chalcone synthase [Halalkalibacter wakoensis JCM 9140]
MSSPTVLYVLEQFMLAEHADGEYGLMAALGPGFCSELVLLQWKEIH